MEQVRVIISGGGTGGHIFPAIAIANAIKKRYPDAAILFVGAKDRMEMTKVPAAGYEIVGLEVSGFNRKSILKNISVLSKLLKSLLGARKIIKSFKPQIAIGVGGYASGPTLRVANFCGVPTLLQEQNSYAGVTNKLLAKKAETICVAYEGMDKFFPQEKIVLTGNPCRQDLLNPSLTKEEAIKFFNLDPGKRTLLVVGGSLGSKTLNHSVLKYYEEIAQSDVQVIWQCGEYYLEEFIVYAANRGNADNIFLFDFISRMDLAYKAADLVISRAGAGAISELSLLAKSSILVPSPNVAEDHQTKNAEAFARKDAAVMIPDRESISRLIPMAMDIIHDEAKLKNLSENIAKLAEPNSADRIVEAVMKIIEKNKK